MRKSIIIILTALFVLAFVSEAQIVARNLVTGFSYTNLQDAIDAASSNAIVYLLRDSSNSVMVTNKSNIIITKDPFVPNEVILCGTNGPSNFGIDIRNSSNITISNITVMNWERGVNISNAADVTAKYIMFSNNSYWSNMGGNSYSIVRGSAIYADISSNCTALLNQFINNGRTGVLFTNTIGANSGAFSNTFTGTHDYGIRIFFGESVNAKSNYFFRVSTGINSVSNEIRAVNNICESNTSYGMVHSGSYMYISRNSINGCYNGILIIGASNTAVSNMIINSTFDGLTLSSISYSTIIDNAIYNNRRYNITGSAGTGALYESNYFGDRQYALKRISLTGTPTIEPWRNGPIDFTRETATPDIVSGIIAQTNVGNSDNVYVRWDACTNADFSNYIIFRTIGNNYSNLSDGDIICRAYASNATNIVDTPGVSGMYYYFATAVDTNGNESWYSAPASITFNGGYAVSNTNTGVRYIDLASACSAVADNETLHVLMNIQGAGAVVNGRSGVTITKASNIAFTPQLRGDFASTGIFFSNCTACTIRDLQFTSYAMGIAIMDSGGMLLSNITISVSVSNAIALFTNATNTTIRAASLFSNQCGIRVWSHGNTISGSHITSNFGEGILFMYSNATSNAIVGNDVIANGYNVYGIDACLSVGTMIASNLVQLNYSGLATGISNYVYNNRFISNTSSAIYIGKGGTTTRGTSIVCNELMSSVIYPYSSGNGIYFNGPQNSHFIASNSIISFYYGIYINNGLSNSVFLSNAIISNSYGIYNFNSGVSSNIIAGNYFTRNFSYGLFIYSAKTNLIMSNMFSNTAAAICISGACELNTICYNIMKNNSYGCIISWISTNTIAFNNFQNNTRNLYIGTLINFCFAVSNYYGTRTFSNMSVSSNVFDVAPWRLTPIDFTKNITPPDCPALVTAATNAIREVNVAWSPVTNGGLSHYNIFRSTAPTFHDILDSELVATVSAGTTNYTDTPQVTNTYRYYVTAVDTNDNEGWYSPAAVVLVTTVNYIPVISNFSAVPDVALGYVALSYSLYDSNTTDLMTGTFEYTESGKSNWTAIAAASISNAPVNCSNGDYVSYWYPSGIDTTKKIDIRMRVTSRDRVSAYAYDLDTILSGMFSMRSDLAQIKTLNNPYRGAEPGIVFVNLTADAVITVYTVTGKFVSEVTVDKNTPDGLLGRAIWDVRNKQDAAVTAGIYICIVRSPSLNKSRTVKVLVAR